jgi:DNA processing protein
VSPFERTQHATLTTFPQRNGVLAALTQATVVVQAPLKSGARSTAAFARRLRRPLFIVPTSPWDRRGAGNLAELELGATALTDEKRLFQFLGVAHRAVAGPRDSKPKRCGVAPAAPRAEAESALLQLPPSHRAVFEATQNGPRHVDDLCVRTGLPAALVQAALLTLTLEAVLVEGPAGWVRRVK